jgi:hypothetical protein
MVPSQTMGLSHGDPHDFELRGGYRHQLRLKNKGGAWALAQATHAFFAHTIEAIFRQDQCGAFVSHNRGDLKGFFKLLYSGALID